MYINDDRHWHSQSAMVITEARRTGGKYASITRYVFYSGFPRAFKKKQWLRESAPQAMEILVYWHIFRRKHSRIQMQVSEHKMYLIFCSYRVERLRVNTNPKN